MKSIHQRKTKRLLVAIGLIAVTVAAYLPLFQNQFVNYDDPGYVVLNPHVGSGLTLETVLWSFTTFQESNWHPLTWLSHALDVTLFGISAPAHHGMNLLIHLLSAVLLYIALEQMTGARWQSAFVAMVFAIHPLHVESVAWISERKDVLSGLFMMLTILAYVRYVHSPVRKYYIAAIGLFALGLLAKPMLVTLPFALLLFDYWPLRRLSFDQRGPRGGEKSARSNAMILAEKIPFILLSAASSVMTYIAQERGGAIAEAGPLPFAGRAANALVSYTNYLVKSAVPTDLAFFYPYRTASIAGAEIAIALVVLTVLSTVAIRLRKSSPYFAVGWFMFLGMLVPVIGIVQVGLQAMADRYMYLPLIGIGIIVAWGAPEITKSIGKNVWLVRAGLILAGTFMGVLTWGQTQVWKDNVTLYSHAISVTEDNHIAHTNLGVTLADSGRDAEAIPHFREALRLWPRNYRNISNLALSLAAVGDHRSALQYYRTILPKVRPDPRLNLRVGDVYSGLGELDSAMAHYVEAIRLDSSMIEAHVGMADIYSRKMQFEDARKACDRIFAIQPGSSKGHDMLGIVAGRQNLTDEAMEEFKKAIDADSLNERGYLDLGVLYERMGKLDEARGMYENAIRVNPRNANARSKLGLAYARGGDLGAAEKEWLTCLEIAPASLDSRMNLGRLYTMQQKTDEAIFQYQAILSIDSTRADVHYLLGNLFASRRAFVQSERHYRAALKINPEFREAHDALRQLRSMGR